MEVRIDYPNPRTWYMNLEVSEITTRVIEGGVIKCRPDLLFHPSIRWSTLSEDERECSDPAITVLLVWNHDSQSSEAADPAPEHPDQLLPLCYDHFSQFSDSGSSDGEAPTVLEICLNPSCGSRKLYEGES